MSQRFLTIDDVSDRLSLSLQAVRAMIQRGELPAIQVGPRKLWRIPEESFDEYVRTGLERTAHMVATKRARKDAGTK